MAAEAPPLEAMEQHRETYLPKRPPLDVVATEEPYVAALVMRHLDTHCSNCFRPKRVKKVKRCADCKILRYCSVKCQLEDWRVHKIECVLMMNFAKRKGNEVYFDKDVRCITRLLIRTYLGDDENVKAFNGITFRRLLGNTDKWKRSGKAFTNTKVVMEQVNEFLGWAESVGPHVEKARMGTLFNTILAHFSKQAVNGFAITNPYQQIGCGLFLGVSELNHSCSPDMIFSFEDRRIVLRSSKPGLVYNRKLTIAYMCTLFTTAARQKHFRDGYHFECSCVVCRDQEWDNLKYSLKCGACDDGICLVGPESDTIVCSSCSAPHKMSVKEALAAYWELEQLNAGKKHRSDCKEELEPKQQLQQCLDEYDRCRKVFSKYNLELAALAYRVANLFVTVGETGEARRWVDKFEPAFRKHMLPDPMFVCTVDNMIGKLLKRADRMDEKLRKKQREENEGGAGDAGGDVLASGIEEEIEAVNKVESQVDQVRSECNSFTCENPPPNSEDLPPLLDDGEDREDDKAATRRQRKFEELVRFYTFLFESEAESVISEIVHGPTVESECNQFPTPPTEDQFPTPPITGKAMPKCGQCSVS